MSSSRFFRPFYKIRQFKSTSFIPKLPDKTHVRYRVTTENGALLPEPQRAPFGLLRILLTVLPGLYLGATISKEAAAFLEENDIFVPEEDDDED